MKPSAATPALMKHRGRAVVFESIEDYHARIDDDELDIDASCVMVLKYVGPVGYPGMPEVGNMTLPKKILQQGVTDMIRISDGRMSGTALWHGGVACFTRISYWRQSCPGTKWRYDRAGCRAKKNSFGRE